MGRYIHLCVALFLSAVALSTQALAQDSVRAAQQPRRFKIFPVPAFGYTPETRLNGGAVLLSTFSLSRDTAVRYSTAKLKGTYTANKQLIFETDYALTLPGSRWLLFGSNLWMRFPEFYWGIGPATPESAKEHYQANRLELANEADYRVYRRVYLGATQRLQAMYNVRATTNGLLDTFGVAGSGGALSSGIGPVLLVDARDRLLNPSGGCYYAALRPVFFQPAFGSRYTFTNIEADLRWYVRAFWHATLALQTYHVIQSGQAPFRMLPLLGADGYFRGIYQGRFRDKNLHTAQAELRMPIFKWFGITAFGCVGDVRPEPFSVNLQQIKATLGGGIRILVDKRDRTNLRFDYAAGKGYSGFYVAFGEAF